MHDESAHGRARHRARAATMGPGDERRGRSACALRSPASPERAGAAKGALALALVAATSAAVGCEGTLDGGPGAGGGGGTSTPTSFACDPSAVPTALPLRRLSKAQYSSTIRELVRFGLAAAPGEVDAVLAAVEPLFARVPGDLRLGPDKHYAGFSNLDQAVQQEHVDAAYDVAVAAGAELTSTATRLAALAGECATDADGGNDDACMTAFIESFGERALRRAITPDDVTFYKGPAGTAPFEPADWADVTALMLTSPHTLYFVEHGRESDTGEHPELDAYELASRLSYHFWQTLPDEQLFARARSGELLDPAVYEAEVERVFADDKTRAAVGTFFSEWLENTTLQELDSRAGTPVFDAFAGDFTPGPELRERMLAEVVDAATYYAFDAGGTFRELLESHKSFARTEDLATIYGVAPWDGVSEPPDFADPERVGLFTRAAYLATGSANTRPIMKGVFLRKALLCDDVPPPPPNAAATPPEPSGMQTTREAVEALTGTGNCAGCHSTIINPLGFATEGFDALGRARSTQVFYDAEGVELGSAAVDTTSVPRVDDGDLTESTGPADLLALVVASEKPHACFARQYFRWSFARLEDLDLDACALSDVKATLDEGAPMADALRVLALTPAFRRRSFQE